MEPLSTDLKLGFIDASGGGWDGAYPAVLTPCPRPTGAQISVGTDRVPWERIAVRCGHSSGCECGARDRDGVIDSVADSGVFIRIGENLEARVCSPVGIQIDVPGFGAASPAPSQRR